MKNTDGLPPSPDPSGPLVAWLCREALAPRSDTFVVGLQGVAVSRCAAASYAGVVYASDDRAADLDGLQETLGEGPGPQSLAEQRPVLVPDLLEDPRARSWPVFTPAASALGIASVFAVPVQIGAVGLGLLTAHGRRPTPLAPGAVEVLLRLSDAVALALLAPTGVTVDGSDERDGSDGLDMALDLGLGPGLDDVLDSGHAVTHQAVGMVSVQLDASLADAMSAMRSRAFASDRRLVDLARDVVARRISFRDSGVDGQPGRELRCDEGDLDDQSA